MLTAAQARKLATPADQLIAEAEVEMVLKIREAFVKCGSAVVSERERWRAALAELSAEFRIGGDEYAAVRLETVLETLCN